jgi:hypothetical protein
MCLDGNRVTQIQWSQPKKLGILIVVSLYSFLGNSALLGPAVYLVNFAKDFGVDVNKASGIVSYPNLAYGFGKILWTYAQKGENALMLGCLQVHCCWCRSTTRLGGGLSCWDLWSLYV